MHIDRIVVTGDVLRTTDGDPNQLTNVRWLDEELRRVLQESTGLTPEIRYRRNVVDDGRSVVAGWYALLGHAPSLEAWAATYAMSAPPALVDALAPDYERALVIGFELSPLLRSALDSLGVPWIDVEVSPIRFLDDLALTVRCSWPLDEPADGGAGRRRHPGLLTPGQIEEAVSGLRARYQHDATAAACSGACIFLAQTSHDRTLIKDGRFFPGEEALERVRGMLGGRRLILKPHPLQPDNPLIDLFQEQLAAAISDANVYALLTAARDAHFLTISSSAGVEASHFGHNATMLHPEPHAHPAPLTSLWAHRSTTFWRAVLGPLLPLRAGAAFEERLVPDRMRRKLSAWGFTRPSLPAQAAASASSADALASA